VRKAGAWAVSIERANHRSEWPETLRVQFRRFADNSAKWKVPSKTKLWPTIRQKFVVVGKDPSRISVPITRLSVPDTATDSFASKPRVFYKTFTALTIIWEL